MGSNIIWRGVSSEIPVHEITEWPVAYHGTSCENLPSILSKGLRKPGEVPWLVAMDGNGVAGKEGAIYVTPSLFYASHPVYSTLKKIRHERWIQIALKLRVRPGTCTVQANTLSNSSRNLGFAMPDGRESHVPYHSSGVFKYCKECWKVFLRHPFVLDFLSIYHSTSE